MGLLLQLSRLIDALTTRLGAALIWLILLAVLLSAGNAIVRKAFSVSSNAMLELQWYLFAAVFMLGAGYAFLKNVHVRIDFVSNRLSARTRNLIDIVGILVFLLPLCYMIVTISWPLFVGAWESGEMSQNAGGLIRWPMYLLAPAGFVLLALQGFSEIVKRIAFLTGAGPDALAHHAAGSKDPVEQEIEEHAALAKEEVR